MMMKYAMAVMMLSLGITSVTYAEKSARSEFAVLTCMEQGELANTVQNLRQQHPTLTLSITKDIVKHEMQFTGAKKELTDSTLEFLWNIKRNVDAQDADDIVLANCIRGYGRLIKGTK